MTTYVPFTPNTNAPFQFSPTLDGQAYTAIINWNVFGQRYYLDLNTLSGGLIFSLPLVGSPADYDISIPAGYFNSTLVYRVASGQFEVNP